MRVTVPVQADLEITEITDRVAKKGGPALLFEDVVGHRFPVATNIFGSTERLKLAFEVTDLDELGDRVAGVLSLVHQEPGIMARLRTLPKLARLASYLPKTVRTGPCKEVIEREKPSLSEFPVLRCWPEDGGRFLTLPLVFTKNPVTGVQNVGMYRLQVFDDRTTGMHWHLHKDGAQNFAESRRAGMPGPVGPDGLVPGEGETEKDGRDRHSGRIPSRTAPEGRFEVAVALGGDPAVIYSATAPLPRDIDEMAFAGFLRQGSVDMVPCETVDLMVPAHSEAVLEGYVDPEERRVEGPFGDHTGFYSPADLYPVFHITCITRRRDPIYPATIVGRPPMEDAFLGKLTERVFLPLLRLQVPEVNDINLPPEGGFHNCVIVSIKKAYPGHARKVAHALWGMGQMMLSKFIVVLDEEVNVQDLREVAWRVLHNVDPERDMFLSKGPLDVLDHSSPAPLYGSKMGIDATVKLPEEGHPRPWPRETVMSPEVVSLVSERWLSYGFAPGDDPEGDKV